MVGVVQRIGVHHGSREPRYGVGPASEIHSARRPAGVPRRIISEDERDMLS
jgi:hypothetical protein